MHEQLEQLSTSFKPVLISSKEIKDPKKTHTATAPPTKCAAQKPTPCHENQTKAIAYSIVGFAKRKQ